jgi:hypothetical protein
MSARRGYNDMNTNAPNPFVTKGKVVLSGAGKKKITSNGITTITPDKLSQKHREIKYPKPPKNKKKVREKMKEAMKNMT